MNYRLLMVWNDVEPELNPNTYTDWDEFVAHAKRVREMEGKDHGLYFLEWTEGIDGLTINAFAAHHFDDQEETSATADDVSVQSG